jgi:hypothetical protein
MDLIFDLNYGESMSYFRKHFFLSALMSCSMFFTFLTLIHSKSITNNGIYPHFCQLASDNNDIFKDFKRNPLYQQVLEHVSYEEGLLYLDIITKEHPELLSKMDAFRQNDIFGNPFTYDYGSIGYFSPTTLRYIKVAGDLTDRFGDLSKMHIVEIGGSYGGQCKIIAELTGFASYTLIDLPECNALSKKYLSELGVKNVYFIDNDQISQAMPYDLVISNYAFSEIDQVEQKNYIKYIINRAPNGYMIMNFISSSFNLKSVSMEKLVRRLYMNGRNGKVEAERPCTHPKNLLLTWYENETTLKKLQKQPALVSSPDLQTCNAVSYSLSGGRLGDNLVAYFHARWLSYKYGLPLLYKPFPESDQFCLDDMDSEMGNNFLFQNVISIREESDIQTTPSSSLFICPYFPETRNEYEWCNLSYLPFFSVNWEEPDFHEEVVRCLKPKQDLLRMKLPKNCITVAVHLRRGPEFNNPENLIRWPLKFVPDSYYITQIRRLANIFHHKKLYIYVFTDDEQPQVIVNNYRKILNNPNITFACQKVNRAKSLLEDFYSISQFDCCILCQSNFSLMASKLGNYSVSIAPVHCIMKDNVPVIDEIDLVFRGKE